MKLTVCVKSRIIEELQYYNYYNKCCSIIIKLGFILIKKKSEYEIS